MIAISLSRNTQRENNFPRALWEVKNKSLLYPLISNEDFLMPTAIMQQTGIRKAGTCPHGLPIGACPICNGMGGGMKTADHTAKPGEMSWNECAAIGAMLKAQKNAKIARQQEDINFAQKIAQFEKNMMNISQKIAVTADLISKNLPPIIAAPTNFILKNIIGGVVNLIKNIPSAMQKFSQVIQQKFIEISDKLAAIYGEIKAAIAKKIDEPLNLLKKKVKSLFSIFDPQNLNNEELQIDETKKAFRLRTFIHDLYKKIKGKDNFSEEQKEGIK